MVIIDDLFCYGVTRFADDIFDYDNVCPLDSWSLRMLRRYKVFLDEDFRKDQERKVRLN